MQHPQHLQAGDRVPDTAFKIAPMANGENIWCQIAGVILFASGAFTPTCTTSHLPGFASAIDRFKELGVEEIFAFPLTTGS